MKDISFVDYLYVFMFELGALALALVYHAGRAV